MQKKPEIFLVAHSHIDVEWLWDVSETKEIAFFTFKKVVNLLEKYPFLTFTNTSSIFLEWIKEKDTELFHKIQKLFEKGQFELASGLYLEPDLNLISEKSFDKNIKIGKKFLKENFGFEPKVMFIPDSFGYPPYVVKILKDNGFEYFITSKLNYQTRFPFFYNYFIWEGINNEKIIACQTIGGYEGEINEDKILSQLQFIIKKQKIPVLLYIFGKGDHGGGIENYMVKNALDFIEKYKNEIEIKFSKLHDFFEELKKYEEKLPIYKGELYLKTHRGTFTTQANIKEFNSKAEKELTELDFFISKNQKIFDKQKLKEKLESLWKKLIFYQFHDTLSGTCIYDVYKRFEKDKEKFWKEVKKLKKITGKENFLVNPEKNRKIFILEDPKTTRWHKGILEPFEISKLEDKLRYSPELKHSFKGEKFELIHENNYRETFFKIDINNERVLEKCFFKIIEELEEYEESAWNIIRGKEKNFILPLVEKRDGFLKFEGKIGEKSKGILLVKSFQNYPRVVLKIKIDWQEEWKFLKICFLPSFYTEEYYTGTQMGIIKRIAYFSKNADFEDKEKWEVPFFKFCGVEKEKYGIKVFCETRYGVSFEPDGLCISLLRSTKNPDPKTVFFMNLKEKNIEFQDKGYYEIKLELEPYIKEKW